MASEGLAKDILAPHTPQSTWLPWQLPGSSSAVMVIPLLVLFELGRLPEPCTPSGLHHVSASPPPQCTTAHIPLQYIHLAP
eukprot:661763-Pelagomonas_calceolata.AAC.8